MADNLPNNLRKVRKNHPNKALRVGENVALAMGISKQYYYDLETGRNNARLNQDHIAALTKIFDVSADEILSNAASDTPDTQKKQPADLKRFLNQAEVMYDGELYDLDDKDREILREALEHAFWYAKQRNKRKKSE